MDDDDNGSFSTRFNDDDDDDHVILLVLHFPIFTRFFFTRYNDDVHSVLFTRYNDDDDDDDDDTAENTSFKVAPSIEGHPFDRSDQSLISFGICSGCGSVLRRSLSSAKSTKMHTRESAPS